MAKIGYLNYRARSGHELNGAQGWHYVQFGPFMTGGVALCGLKPIKDGPSWSFDNGHEISCPICLRIMRQRGIDRYKLD